MCGMHGVLGHMRSRAVLMESRHGEGQTDKQGLYQRKRSDRVLTTYIRYKLGWAASEEFWEGVKLDLVFEHLGWVLQLSFGPFVVFQEAWMERVTIIKPWEDKGGHKCFCRFSWKKMLNCANTAEFRVGRSADILYVQFHAHVISDVKTKISGRRRKQYFTATVRDDSRFSNWKGLRRWAQAEGLCFIILSLSLFSSI